MFIESGDGSICIFEATLVEKSQAPINPTILTGNPRIRTNPKSACRIPAAPTGPGVGGMIECVRISPSLKAIAPAANEIFACFVNAFARGAKMINPESQKTGILIIAPIKLKARGTFFLPTNFKVPPASAKAPPDFSRNLPMIEPARMISPMNPMVFPNPELID